jgi:hypothetical protein
MTTNGAVTQLPRRDRFASGAAVRLELSDGDWVLVRQELTYGQQRHLATAGLTGLPPSMAAEGQGQEMTVDWARFDIERLVAYVIDWSFVDADGDRVLVSREAIEALHPDTAAEIQAALDAHVGGQEAKKAPAPPGTSAPAATSSSARRSAGAGRS